MHNKLCKKNHLVFDWSYRTIASPVNSVRKIALCRWLVYFPLTLSLVVSVATVHLVILSITLQHKKICTSKCITHYIHIPSSSAAELKLSVLY